MLKVVCLRLYSVSSGLFGIREYIHCVDIFPFDVSFRFICTFICDVNTSSILFLAIACWARYFFSIAGLILFFDYHDDRVGFEH